MLTYTSCPRRLLIFNLAAGSGRDCNLNNPSDSGKSVTRHHKVIFMKALKSILIAAILVFTVFGCGDDNGGVAGVSESYTPQVRLVKDGPSEFHFQWGKPLKEERIILCRFESFFLVVTAANVIEGYKPTGFPQQKLVYFPEGSFISKPLTDELVFIEILSAHKRDTFPLPANVFDATADLPICASHSDCSYPFVNPHWDAYRRILREHPFKPYRVGNSSQLSFDIPTFNQ